MQDRTNNEINPNTEESSPINKHIGLIAGSVILLILLLLALYLYGAVLNKNNPQEPNQQPNAFLPNDQSSDEIDNLDQIEAELNDMDIDTMNQDLDEADAAFSEENF